MASNFKLEIEMKTPAEKLWSITKEFGNLLPKALPHICEKIDVLEGDGEAVGTILLVIFKPGPEEFWTIKERIDLVNDEKKILSYSFIDGDVMRYFKSYKGTINVCSRNDGAIIKYTGEYEKANEEVPHPDFFKDFVVNLFKNLDAHLLKA